MKRDEKLGMFRQKYIVELMPGSNKQHQTRRKTLTKTELCGKVYVWLLKQSKTNMQKTMNFQKHILIFLKKNEESPLSSSPA